MYSHIRHWITCSKFDFYSQTLSLSLWRTSGHLQLIQTPWAFLLGVTTWNRARLLIILATSILKYKMTLLSIRFNSLKICLYVFILQSQSSKIIIICIKIICVHFRHLFSYLWKLVISDYWCQKKQIKNYQLKNNLFW